MRISGFMHGITNPELIKRLHDNIPKSVDEMWRATTEFLRGEVAASNQARRKGTPAWKLQEGGRKYNKNEKVSHVIKELKQNSGKDSGKVAKKGEAVGKDKPPTILMVQPWQRVARQRITQSFSSNPEISFPSLREEDGTEGPITIEAEMGEPSYTALVTLRSSRIIPLECKMVSGLGTQQPLMNQTSAIEEKIKIAIHPEQTIEIGSTLSEEWREELYKLLRKSLDVFAWKPADMTGVPRHIAELRLNVWEGCLPVRQKKRGQAPERNKAIQEEVENWPEDKLCSHGIANARFGQIIADFIVERLEDNPPAEHMEEDEKPSEPWILFTNGSSCVDGSGVRLILTNPEGIEFTYALRFRFEATNNEAEYEALIVGLNIAEQMGVQNLQANVDSRLVANQVFSIKQIPRSENRKADALSKIASTSFAHLSKQVLVEKLKEKSIMEGEVLGVVEEGDTWMTPLHNYLTSEALPKDKKVARAIRRKSTRYAITNGILYKKSFLGPWLRCVRTLQVNYVLREVHEGSCNMHAGPRSVVAKALRIGYYWPIMHKDAREMIRACHDCQGIDIARLFLEGPGKVKFLIVAIDNFTKWIEVKPVATITGNYVKKFVWDNIVYRFGLPREIVSDNGKQFRDNPFKDWCEKLHIHQCFASVKHPQANEFVAMEKCHNQKTLVMEGEKKRVMRRKGRRKEMD
ncbi:reverse transcriptase domain-containing protein [Tanacetum coccineum]